MRRPGRWRMRAEKLLEQRCNRQPVKFSWPELKSWSFEDLNLTTFQPRPFP